jgi:hypothetical protein
MFLFTSSGPDLRYIQFLIHRVPVGGSLGVKLTGREAEAKTARRYKCTASSSWYDAYLRQPIA